MIPSEISIVELKLAAMMTQAAVMTIFFVLGVFPKGKRDVTVVCTFKEVIFLLTLKEDSCVFLTLTQSECFEKKY